MLNRQHSVKVNWYNVSRHNRILYFYTTLEFRYVLNATYKDIIETFVGSRGVTLVGLFINDILITFPNQCIDIINENDKIDIYVKQNIWNDGYMLNSATKELTHFVNWHYTSQNQLVSSLYTKKIFEYDQDATYEELVELVSISHGIKVSELWVNGFVIIDFCNSDKIKKSHVIDMYVKVKKTD